MKRRDSHIFVKAKDGFYVEPSWCSKRLFERERFVGKIWDPACGWGTITLQAKLAGYRVLGSDIVDRNMHNLGRGFFQHDFLDGVEKIAPPKFSIVTNPPFDHVQEFAERAIMLGAKKIAMIMLVRRLNAARWLMMMPLAKIWLLTPRPSMPPGEWIAKGNDPGGGTQDFCWLVLERGYTKGAPTIDWLTRDDGSGRTACAGE